MIRLIALHGSLSGSVVLNSSGGRTEFMLKTRRSAQTCAEGLSAFLIAPNQSGGFRMERAEIVNCAGSADIDGVRGMLITNSNAIIAEGSSGMSETAMERAKVQLRLTFPKNGGAAEPQRAQRRGEVTAQERPTGKNETEKAAGNAEPPTAEGALQASASPVTRRILSQAKALFGAGDADAFLFDDASASEEKPSPELETPARSAASPPSVPPAVEPYMPNSEAVKNPFPALFPNSSWRKKAGETALSGKVKHRGRLYSVAAVPREGRFQPSELSPFSNIRTAKSEDGKMYWLGIKRM